MEIIHGFLEISYSEENNIECVEHLCGRPIASGEKCFIDVQENGKVYCSFCGPCERYHRKKATQREEA